MTTKREAARRVAPLLARLIENAASTTPDVCDRGAGVVVGPPAERKDAAA